MSSFSSLHPFCHLEYDESKFCPGPGFSPKRRSRALLSECPTEKIIKVIKIIHIFSEKKIDKTSKEICFFKLNRSIALTPDPSIPQSEVVAKKQSKRANQMRSSLRKRDQLACCLFKGKLLHITNFHVMAAKQKFQSLIL